MNLLIMFGLILTTIASALFGSLLTSWKKNKFWLLISIILVLTGAWLNVVGIRSEEKNEAKTTIEILNVGISAKINSYEKVLNTMHKLHNDEEINKDFDFAVLKFLLYDISNYYIPNSNVSYRVPIHDLYFEKLDGLTESIETLFLLPELRYLPELNDLIDEYKARETVFKDVREHVENTIHLKYTEAYNECTSGGEHEWRCRPTTVGRFEEFFRTNDITKVEEGLVGYEKTVYLPLYEIINYHVGFIKEYREIMADLEIK